MNKSLVWLTAYVEQCLRALWETCDVETNGAEDYPFRWGTAAGVVRVEDEPLLVRVVAVAAHGVRRSAKLLIELNEINARSRVAHVYWHDRMVFVEHVLPAEGVDVETLEQAIAVVGSVADDIGILVAALFGGGTPVPATEDTADEELS